MIPATAVMEIAARCDCERCHGERYESYRANEIAAVLEKWRGLAEAVLARSWHLELDNQAADEKRRFARVMGAMPLKASKCARYDFADSPEMQLLRALTAASNCGIVVLAGAPGTGKTVAATRLAFEAFENPLCVTAAAWARWPRFGDERSNLRTHIEGNGELVLDDLGAEVPVARATFLADLDELIDQIYSTERWAVITTNCTLPEFKKRYGARIADRLAECGEWIPFSGPSKRGAKA